MCLMDGLKDVQSLFKRFGMLYQVVSGLQQTEVVVHVLLVEHHSRPVGFPINVAARHDARLKQRVDEWP